MDTRNIPFANTILFNLNTFVTPKIVKIFYLVGMGTIVLKFIQAVIFALSIGFFNGLAGILAAGATAIFSFLILRIAAEMIIVFFKNNESLAEMAGGADQENDIFDDVKESFNALFPQDDDMDLDLGEQQEPAAKPAPKASPAKPAAKTTRAKPAAKRTTRAKPKAAASTRAKPAAAKPATRTKPAPKS